MTTQLWQASKYMKTKKDVKEVLKYVFEEGHPESIALTLYDVAKARGGLTKLAKETGVSRVGLYKIMKGQVNPSLPTMQKILKAFGLKITIT